ncbi:hypothetical protein GGR56DRAFT_266760 [Xylariaceae sp. FL0804]|nr:hypothetical protein GGR56DRAFT_266760 [Xylariaceae sp. FL0804]
MSHPPSTPVKVPGSAATYTPATLDPDLRSQINTLLLREGYINKIQDHLLHSLDAHSSNWPSQIQTHALTLLRSGEVSTFPALVRRVLEDVRHATTTSSASSSSSSSSSSTAGGAEAAAPSQEQQQHGEGVNGTAAAAATTNGKSGGGARNGVGNGGGGGGGPLAIPDAVVEAVLKLARESLGAVCEIAEEGAHNTAG